MKDFKTKNGKFTNKLSIGSQDPSAQENLRITSTTFAGLRLAGGAGYAGSDWTIYASSNDNSNDIFGIHSNDPLDPGYRFVVEDTGNVGIGTKNPNAALEVKAGSTKSLILNNNQASGYLELQSSDNTQGYIQWGMTTAGATGGDDLLLTNTVTNGGVAITKSGVAQLYIKSDGNVGIGTTGPGEILVIQNSSNPTIQIRDGDPGSASARTAGALHLGEASTLGVAIENYTHNYNDTCSMLFKTTAAASTITERMRIDPDGNVGIGTTDPGSGAGGNSSINPISNVGGRLLHLENNSGNSTLVLGSSNQPSIMFAEGDAPANEGYKIFRISGGKSQFVNLNDNGTEKNIPLCIGADGNVGIGSTNPNEKLQISNGYIGVDNGYGLTSVGGIEYIADSDNNAPVTGVIHNFFTDNLSTSAFAILKSGNVGIGTTNPGSKLTILNTGSASVDAITLNWEHLTSSSGLEQRIKWRFGDDATSESLTDAGYIAMGKYHGWTYGGNRSSYLSFATTNAGTQNEKMRIAPDGNVGIGTTSPGYKLQVSANASTWATLITNDNASPFGLAIQYPTGSPSTTNNDFIRCYTGSAVMFRVYSNGNVVSASNSYTSDDRIKHNEEKIVDAIETLSKITPKKYFKTSELYDANHDFDLDSEGNPVDENGEPVSCSIEAGVIAQEVLGVEELKFTVSPELKDEDGNVTSPYGLDYNSLFTYAIAAIQEQQQIIEDLKSRVSSLENN